MTEMPEPQAPPKDIWSDLQPLLDQELSRLPDKYRVPIVLCDLEGKGHKEAARQLGWPQGTVSGRLARGRVLLARRLGRHGLVLAGSSVAGVLSGGAASASVPASLMSSTVQAASLLTAGQAATSGLISAKVAALTEGVLRTMFVTQLKITGVLVLALTMLGTGMGVVCHRTLAVLPAQAQAANSFQAEEGRQERGRRENPAPADRGREREVRKPPAFQGRITAISEDGKMLSLEGGSRGEEPKKMEIKLTAKTKVGFDGVLKELGVKLRVGDFVAVWLQEGSTDTAAVVEARRGPDLSSKIKAVSADGKVLTLTAPSKIRGEEPINIEIKLTDQTKVDQGRRTRGPADAGEDKMLKVGYVASVWLKEGSKDTAAALQVSPPRPDVAGEITAISKDGKTLTLQSPARGGGFTNAEIKLTDATKIKVDGAAKGEDKKLKVGCGATIWLQEGSRDTAATVQAIPAVQLLMQRRGPDVAGSIAAISADFKVLTLESRTRGEEQTTKTDIKIADKTQIVFAEPVKEEDKKLTVGYTARVWLQEGSKDTAAVVQAAKPGERRR